MKRTFSASHGMSPIEVAKTLSAYLMGYLSFSNSDLSHGPFQKIEGDDSRWQLDGSNEFWLKAEDLNYSTYSISCRYPGQEVIIKSMVSLFNALYNK